MQNRQPQLLTHSAWDVVPDLLADLKIDIFRVLLQVFVRAVEQKVKRVLWRGQLPCLSGHKPLNLALHEG